MRLLDSAGSWGTSLMVVERDARKTNVDQHELNMSLIDVNVVLDHYYHLRQLLPFARLRLTLNFL